MEISSIVRLPIAIVCYLAYFDSVHVLFALEVAFRNGFSSYPSFIGIPGGEPEHAQ